MKAPIRYAFLLFFITLFVWTLISTSTRLNELLNFESKQSSLNRESSRLKIEFNERKKIRLRKFKDYLDEHNLDQLDSNLNVNRSVWKQISYRSSFGYHQGNIIYIIYLLNMKRFNSFKKYDL